MRGVYGHVSPAMRAELKAALQERWKTSLRERARISTRSSVGLLDTILAGRRHQEIKIGSRLAPKIGHQNGHHTKSGQRLGL
jgi:hypothetical protein